MLRLSHSGWRSPFFLGGKRLGGQSITLTKILKVNMIQRFRPLLSLVLACLAAFLVSCGGAPKASIPTTYTEAQLERIQAYATNILEKHQRFDDLPAFLQDQDYQRLQAVTGGPLGQMLQDMYNLNRNLLPKDQKLAQKATRALFDDFVAMEKATQAGNKDEALNSFSEAARDFQRYLDLIPSS